MIDSGAPPQDAAKYDGDHRWSRWVRSRNRAATCATTRLEAAHQLGQLHGGRVLDEQVDVVVFAVELDQRRAEVRTPPRGRVPSRSGARR
jgi:hypothetical protein